MGIDTIGQNKTFPIYNADGTPFHNLVVHNAVVDSVVMSLGDKITGDVYYIDNTLAVSMSEYVEYKRNEDSDIVKYILVSPPTVVREGMVSDNGKLCGMTKYSFVFYHPMCLLGNIPFTDIAVSSNEQKYLSQNKTFSWIGNLFDMVAKLNKNLQGTQWVVDTNIEHYEQDGVTVTSMWQEASKIPDEPLSFDKNFVSQVLKTSYETWEIPFIIDQIPNTDSRYAQGKRFVILFGTPSNEILDEHNEPYIFRFGQGVGLKNNSRTPKNNKIVTRIVGYGSENNIPYGYPQIRWYGNPSWNYTINNDPNAAGSYPIYKGIVGGQYVQLIKHPFTRTTLMPSVYSQTVFNKVSPYLSDGTTNPDYDKDTEIVDYYDADISYPNPAVVGSESVEIHQFEDIKPELGEARIIDAVPYNTAGENPFATSIPLANFLQEISTDLTTDGIVTNENERTALTVLYTVLSQGMSSYHNGNTGGSYTYKCDVTSDEDYYFVKYVSDNINYDVIALKTGHSVVVDWDDTMDDEGKYKQSYFKITLPRLDFDLYACASITEEMKINMRSGACIGCTFPIQVDWDDYKKNFYDEDGNFDPAIGEGHPRNADRYPNTSQGQTTVIVQKDIDTFGTLMPNIYQQPQGGDKFVILGISLPTTYIDNAEARLDDAAREYMRDNNVHYYEYPLKFDEHFLAANTDILSQIRNNTIVRFKYGNESPMALYVKQMTVKYGGVLPTYDITLTDDVEIVLNQIGQVTDDVSRMRVQVSELQKYYSENIIQAIEEKLSKVVDDVCQGRITFQQGLDSIGNAIFHDEIRSTEFESGLYTGNGWRVDHLGNAEFESVRARSFLEVVELLVNRMQAQEGDTVFSDNDQIDRVDKFVDETDQSVSYVLSLKEKWAGYYTPQMYGNILKGVINTLAAKDAGVSDVQDSQTVEADGSNSYFTSWMRVIATHNTDNTLSTNQIRVVLYGDNEVPAQKNFEPCELMTMTRWGCINYSTSDTSKYEAEGLDTQDAIIASIKRRQQVFYISTSEGRIVKLTGVDSPILGNGNYGTTLGILPEFVQNYPVVHDRMIAGRDYLYAQGVVVGDFIKIDVEGNPVPTVVDCGEWIDGSRTEPLTIKVWDAQQQRYVDHVLTFPIPSSEYNNPSSLYIGHGIYFYNKFNALTQQYETHRVRHNGGTWQCLQSQPVINEGVATYYEPKWNSAYWTLVDGNNNLSIEFASTMGDSFYIGHVSTVITPYLFYGNVDISSDIDVQYWSWSRQMESGKTDADIIWDNNHTQTRILTLGNADMPPSWGRNNKAIFTCTVVINDGNSQVIVQNQVIA